MNLEQLKTELESLIDKNSVSELINAMSEICTEKAQHIRENWQDNKLAKVWDKASDKLHFCSKEVNC